MEAYRAAHKSQAETREARTMEKSGNYLRESVTQSLDTYVILIGRLTSHKLRQERQEQWKVIQVQALMCNTGVRVAVEEVTPR